MEEFLGVGVDDWDEILIEKELETAIAKGSSTDQRMGV